jgi:hypothetical protein
VDWYQCSVYAGIPYRIHFVPEFHYQYITYPLILFPFFWRYNLVTSLKSIPALLNFHFEYWLAWTEKLLLRALITNRLQAQPKMFQIKLQIYVQWCAVKLKLKLPHHTPWRRLGGEEYSSYSFPTSPRDGGEWSASRSGRALAPRKGTPVSIVQEAGWISEPVWTQRPEEKSFRLCRGSNLDRPVDQPVARHYTDWATRLTTMHHC